MEFDILGLTESAFYERIFRLSIFGGINHEVNVRFLRLFLLLWVSLSGSGCLDQDILGTWEHTVVAYGFDLEWQASEVVGSNTGVCVVTSPAGQTACEFTTNLQTKELKIVEPADPDCGPDLVGTYGYIIQGDWLIFSLVDEECDDLSNLGLPKTSRSVLVEGRWHRTAIAPPSPFGLLREDETVVGFDFDTGL